MTAVDPTTDPSRRQVLCGLMVALLAPGALAACGSDSGPTGSPGTTTTGGGAPATTGAPTSATGGGSALATLADVPEGGGALVDGPSGKVLLVRPDAATIKAYDPACPHQGAEVTAPEGGVITCPRHGSTFDPASGARKSGPAQSGLAEIPVKVEGDQVLLA